MRILIAIALTALFIKPLEWSTNFEQTRKHAIEDQKLILVDIQDSNSKIEAHAELNHSEIFKKYANLHLKLLKTSVVPEFINGTVSKNAEVLLISPDGKILKSWTKEECLNPQEIVKEMKQFKI